MIARVRLVFLTAVWAFASAFRGPFRHHWRSSARVASIQTDDDGATISPEILAELLKNTDLEGASYEIEGAEHAPVPNGAPLKQLQLRFDCDAVDSDDISELMFEVGVLSVSVEVQSEKDILNDETRWMELVKTKSWQTALLRANFPSSFNAEGLQDILAVTFPGVEFDCTVVDVENKDWVSDVQKTWLPQRIGSLTVRFPWHSDEAVDDSEGDAEGSAPRQHLVLEGGAAFGTGDHPTTRLCCRWLEDELKTGGAGQTVLDYGYVLCISGQGVLCSLLRVHSPRLTSLCVYAGAGRPSWAWQRCATALHAPRVWTLTR